MKGRAQLVWPGKTCPKPSVMEDICQHPMFHRSQELKSSKSWGGRAWFPFAMPTSIHLVGVTPIWHLPYLREDYRAKGRISVLSSSATYSDKPKGILADIGHAPHHDWRLTDEGRGRVNENVCRVWTRSFQRVPHGSSQAGRSAVSRHSAARTHAYTCHANHSHRFVTCLFKQSWHHKTQTHGEQTQTHGQRRSALDRGEE